MTQPTLNSAHRSSAEARCTDAAPTAPRKPFVAPAVRPQGTMVIQAGSMNLWDMK